MSAPQTADNDRTRRSWRDDPLSVFLAIAAVLLAVMYFGEERQLDELSEATRRAQELAVGPLDIEGCLVHAAGAGGRTLVVKCRQTAEEIAVVVHQKRPALTDFDEVVLVGVDRQFACGTGDAMWPADCESRDNPAPRPSGPRGR